MARAIFIACIMLGTAACTAEQAKETDGGGGAPSSATSTSGGPSTGGGGGCAPTSCSALDAECGTVDDGCGRAIDCGTCAPPAECGALEPNRCDAPACVPVDDATLCLDASKECGLFETVDNCGETRMADCGGCMPPDTCGGEGIPNMCGCTPETDAALCTNNSAECGTATFIDSCGEPRTVDCGSCQSFFQCNANACVCSAPPNVTLQSCVYNGGPKINLTSPTQQVALAYSTGTSPPSSCTFSNSSLHTVMGNGINLSWPGPNQCGWYRVCSWEGLCSNDYATGVTFHICVDSIGQPSCTF